MIRAYIAILLIPILVLARSPVHLREPVPSYHNVTNFQSNMVVQSGTGSSTSSASIVWAGSQSNALVFGTGAVTYLGTVSPSVNVCQDSFFRVAIYLANKTQVTNLATAQIAIGSSGTNYIAMDLLSGLNDTNYVKWPGWTTLSLMRRKMSITGSPVCSAIDTVLFVFRASSGSDTMILGGLDAYPPRIQKGTVIITADDGYPNWGRYGLSKLDSAGFKSTWFLNAGTLGNGTFVTEQGLDSLMRNYRGFELGNHMYKHDTLPLIPLDSTKNLLTRNYNWLRAKGRPGYTLVALPYGATSHTIDSMMRVSGMVDFVRLINSNTESEAQQFGDPFRVKVNLLVGNPTSLAAMKAKVDSAIAAKSTMVLTAHDLCVACTPSTIQWLQSDWSALVDYMSTKVSAGTLQVVGLREYLDRYGGGYGPARKAGMGR